MKKKILIVDDDPTSLRSIEAMLISSVKKLQNNPALKGVPVIFLTALKMRDDDRGLEFEVNVENTSYRTLTNPVDSKTLVAEIERLIK
jgi:CheY-like chemotaxis protein